MASVVIGHHELRKLFFWRDCFTEFVGAFILMSVQASLPLTWGDISLFAQATMVALGMGFVVALLAETLGPFGGAHFNPAVSVSMFAVRKISLLRGVVYILAQCGGTISGTAFIYSMTPEANRERLAATTVNKDLQLWQGVLMEAWLTAILLLAIHGNTNAKRKAVYIPGLFIGLSITLDIMAGIRYTGASMNPARSLGPAVIMNDPEIWQHLWVYWAGPIAGGLMMTFIYFILLDRPGSGYIDIRRQQQCAQGTLKYG